MKPQRHTEHIEFNTSFGAADGSEDVLIAFDRTTVFSHDSSYGSDADGNRGMAVDLVDDDWADHIQLDGVNRVELDLETRQAVDEAVEQYLEDNDPEAPEVPEPDVDDEGD